MNKQAIFAVFNDADDSSASFAERLIALGVGDRATARPLAMEWALARSQSRKLDAGVKIVEGQRGLTFSKRDTAAERMVNRVLDVCFPSADKPAAPKAEQRGKADPVATLLKKYAALTAAQKRAFKAAL